MGIVNWIRTQWDRALALVALVIGLVALLMGWLGVSGNSYVAKQLPYVVSGAMFGIFLVGVAAVLWLSADLRDEWRELRGVRLLLREQLAQAAVSGESRGYAESSAEQTNRIPAVGSLGHHGIDGS